MDQTQTGTSRFRVAHHQQIRLKDYDPAFTGAYRNKKEAEKQLKNDIKVLSRLQYQLYASNRKALLIVFQAMDAAGKDSAIRHVFSGLNPQGCEVHSFKHPSVEELEHDYLWRHYKRLPDRGRIGIFNRSHYENVLVTKVHPQFLLAENLPGIRSVDEVNEDFWETRYRQINDFERTIRENGTWIVKFFLHLSKEEQKKRFLERIENKEKNWKVSAADIEERDYWDEYQKAYEKAIGKTSTEQAPWYVIPADHKWFSHAVIGNILVETLDSMDIRMPLLSKDVKERLKQIRQKLQSE